MRTAISIFTVLSLGSLPVAAMAQAQGGDTTIKGPTTINATGSKITTTAEDHSKASTRVGAISGSKIEGPTTINATATDVTTTAKDHSIADTSVGSIRDASIQGATTINANADKITTTAKNNSLACTEIGTIGSDPCSAAPK